MSGSRRRYFRLETARNWHDIAKLHDRFLKQRSQWVFRGHGSSKWSLETTFERNLRRFPPTGKPKLRIEGALLRRFKRQAHHYLADVPQNDSWLEWLALMQHFGAPTRLLDWTYSFFVGLYFAVEDATRPAALWALNKDWATTRATTAVGAKAWSTLELDQNAVEPSTFAALFARPKRERVPFVCPINPYRFNERLSIQQGTFLCLGDIDRSFEDNLIGMGSSAELRKNVTKCVISLDKSARREVVIRLLRMNVTRTSLFPGLDGFSRALGWWLAVPTTLVPDNGWPGYLAGKR
jgi:hypothetical protein